MFVNRRKRAIKLLETQKAAISKITIYSFGKWKVRTDAIVKQYIGETDFHRQKFRTLDLSNLPKPTEPESKREKWLKAQKILAKEYVDSCLKYLIDNGKMIVEPNWFCKRTVGEIIAIIMGFLTILLAIVLPFTCSQGKIQGAADAKEKIHYLETERDSLKVILLDCLSNLPKPVNNPKEKEGNSTIPNN